MNAPASSTPDEEAWRLYEAERRRWLPRNYWANVLEGGLYMVGAAFMAGETVLPAMVESLGGANWMVAITPILLLLGMSIPSLFTAHIVERFERMKPFVMMVTVFQRLPFLIAGLVLVFWGEEQPHLALPFVILAPLLSGLGAGLAMPAWFEMVCRIIPSERMSSSWALRFLIQGIGGLMAGGVISLVLAHEPGPRGYGYLCLITFAFLVVSFFILMLVHEIQPPREAIEQERETLWGSWRNRWQIWKTDQVFRRFLYARMLGFAYLLPAPYLGLQALKTTGSGEAFLGILVTIQMAGGIVANTISALTGDRLGPRWVLLASRMTLLLMCAGLFFATDRFAWMTLFFLYGFSFGTQQVGFTSMLAQICPPGKRPTFMAIHSLVSLPCLLGAAALAAVLMEHLGGMWTIAGITFVLQLWAGYFLLKLPKRGRV